MSSKGFMLLVLSSALGLSNVAAQESSLLPYCNGSGPDAVTGVINTLDGVTTATESTVVPQICLPNVVEGDPDRCFYYYIPPETTGPVPLIMDVHGVASCPAHAIGYTGWFDMATKNNLIAVWPLVSYFLDRLRDALLVLNCGSATWIFSHFLGHYGS